LLLRGPLKSNSTHRQVTPKFVRQSHTAVLIAEGIDVAIRARPLPIEGSDLMMKVLAQRGHALVASPDLVKKSGSIRVPADLNGLPSLDLGPSRQEHIWKLEGPDGARADIRHQPRLVSDDMIALRSAAIVGVGIVHLPLLMVSDEIREGKLMHLLPGWAPKAPRRSCRVPVQARSAAFGSGPAGLPERLLHRIAGGLTSRWIIRGQTRRFG
jgi:DNA-binding transcriptional LysR family regulator